jgi:hypothetical protein
MSAKPRWRRSMPASTGSPSTKYAPELNDIEVVWHDLTAHHLAHKTFADAAALDHDIHLAVDCLNRERAIDTLVKLRISA